MMLKHSYPSNRAEGPLESSRVEARRGGVSLRLVAGSEFGDRNIWINRTLK